MTDFFQQYAQYGVVAIVLLVALFAIVKILKKKKTEIQSADDFILLLMGGSEKLVTFIMGLAFKDEFAGCTEYAQFKEKCKKLITEQLYDLLLKGQAQIDFNIPDTLKIFITSENVSKVVDKMLALEDVDTFLYDTYMKLVDEWIDETKKLEAETAAANAEIGTDDDIADNLKDLKDIKSGTGPRAGDEAAGTIDIGGELEPKVGEKELIETVE